MPKQIVLIIGAGASHDLHPAFALGPELLQQISDRVTDRTSIANKHVSKLLLKTGVTYSTCWNFVHHLDIYKKNADSPSIDEFLNEISTYPEFDEVKDDFLDIGKFSIMVHILGYEASLANRDFTGLRSDAWLHILSKFIHEYDLLNQADASPVNIKIVTFNYDRNIEHYLSNSPLFQEKQMELKSFLTNSLVHVYGKIGDLEWQNGIDFFSYGEDNANAEKIFSKKDAISIMFPERLKQNTNQLLAANWIHSPNTEIVCTLGFNWDYLNYRLLALNNLSISTGHNPKRLIANVYPFGDEEFNFRRSMSKKIRNVQHDAEITYHSCTDFLTNVFQQVE